MQDKKRLRIPVGTLEPEEMDLLANKLVDIRCIDFLNWVDDWLLDLCIAISDDTDSHNYLANNFNDYIHLYLVRNYLYSYAAQGCPRVGDFNAGD